MSIVAHSPPVSPLLEAWRVAHRAAIRHLIDASRSDCGCTAQRLCADGQMLDDRAEDAERRMGLPPKLAAWVLADEYIEGVAS
jgi:hypothetical protein